MTHPPPSRCATPHFLGRWIADGYCPVHRPSTPDRMPSREALEASTNPDTEES